MPVSGREISTLDFGNLIGGPLNAIVEAQAKSAITTAQFIREVGFNKEGEVINVDFKYNRKNDAGEDQDFTLTVPLLTMIPIPYITVESGTIEFNARVTSYHEATSSTDLQVSTEAEAQAGGWFVSAKVNSKTAYQKKGATTDKEERTFDMKVVVQVKNADIPAGTERLLTLLENVIEEKATGTGGASLPSGAGSPAGSPSKALPDPQTAATKVVTEMIIDGDVSKMTAGSKVSVGGVNYVVAGIDTTQNKVLLSVAGP